VPDQIDVTTHIDRPPGQLPQASTCTLVIFGATGDLARRKLIPALFRLAGESRSPRPSRPASGIAPATTRSPGRYGTWWPITCCSCWR
jgi:hypothetical protein